MRSKVTVQTNGETRAEAEDRREAFVAWCQGRGYRTAAETLMRDWDRMVAFYAYPEAHWPHIRTTNPLESPFAALRLRTDAVKRYKRVDRATALIWKLLMVAEKRLRRLRGSKLLPQVYQQHVQAHAQQEQQPVRRSPLDPVYTPIDVTSHKDYLDTNGETTMGKKIQLSVTLFATSIYLAISSQPVLAYRKKEVWVKDTVSPFDRPEFLYPIIIFIVIVIISVIFSFMLSGRTSVILKRIAIGTSTITGISFIVIGFPVIRVSSSVAVSVSGSPYIEDVYLYAPVLIPFGIVLLVGAFVLHRLSLRRDKV